MLLLTLTNICHTFSQITVTAEKLYVYAQICCNTKLKFQFKYNIEPCDTLMHSFENKIREKRTCKPLEITIYVATSKNVTDHY